MTIQQATPARNGIQVVSALPLARKTFPNAIAAPAQTGSSRTAMMNLTHFGTRKRLAAKMRREKSKTPRMPCPGGKILPLKF
jgi:hypothetical protein